MTKKKDKSQSIAGKWKIKSHILSQTLAALTFSAAEPGPQRAHKSESKMAQEMAQQAGKKNRNDRKPTT